ncbi:MAG: gamma-glutamyltransferase family protein [Candidatus Accumulibacter sp.]|nr:gamma-glutamyltransferase family protein [Accumulibacter sp.]
MKTRYIFQLSPLLLAIFLASCGGGSSHTPSTVSELIVDDDPDSCSVIADSGSPVIVGSGVPGDPTLPELNSGYRLGYKAKHSSKYMIVANTPLASMAGCKVLKAGGSAVDAAVAVQAVLGLSEPQSSGIGGGAFMMYYDAKTKKVYSFDGRETAPAAANNYYLRCKDQNNPGNPVNCDWPVPNVSYGSTAFVQGSGRSIGVPGVMRMLDMAHKEYGKLPWNKLFDSGIELAANGFKVPARMANAIASARNNLARDANAVSTYFHDGDIDRPYLMGEVMTNVAYANTLRTLAEEGADALYTGPLAERLVAKAQQAMGDGTVQTEITPSLMTLEDVANYQAKKRTPACSVYRDKYYVCSMSPPSSGGIAIAQTFGILNNFDLSLYPPSNPENEGGIPHVMGVHLISEAERLAYADRDKYVADTDYVALPGKGMASMLDPEYLKARALLISPTTSMGTAKAGDLDELPLGIDTTEEHGTTHFSIVDAYGNVVSMTTTVESGMGSFHMVDGYILNNQLTDFSANPTDATGAKVANRVSGGKRPRSSMSPTIVFRGTEPGDFILATGSPGGSNIPWYTIKTLIGALDWGLDAQQATSLVDFGNTNSATTNIDGSNITIATELAQLRTALQAMGHGTSSTAQSSGIATIMRVEKDGKKVLQGGADPRREGIALGDGAM